MILLIKLFLAHIIGDFFIQPFSWVKDKEKKKLKSTKFYLHIAVHIALLFLIVYDLNLWPLIITIGVSHFIIDTVKLYAQKGAKSKRYWFFIDQFLHVTAIVLAYVFFVDSHIFDDFKTENMLLLITCLLFLTYPISIIMKVIFTKWNIEALTKGDKSLEDAGKYIGILERLLVFVFIVSNHWGAVGFLITAKSVFRFGDLRESKDRKLTEYVLIGTLISFSIAIAVGSLYIYATH